MPNKYNARAKRLALDNMIRKRAWNAFQASFSELLSARGGDDDDDGGDHDENHDDADDRYASGDDAEAKAKRNGRAKRDGKGKAAANANSLCRTVILCRAGQTTHRSLLHSLCDVPPDSNPPPSAAIRLVSSACPRCLLLREKKKAGSDDDGRTPLHLAIDRGASLDTVRALVEAADDSDDDRLTMRELLMALDSHGRTPLLLAVRRGAHDDVVKYLVDRDVDGSSLLFPGTGRKKGGGGVPLKYVASRESIFVGEGLENPRDLLRYVIVRTFRARMREKFPLFRNDAVGSEGGIRGSTDRTDSTPDGDDDESTCLLQAAIFCYGSFGSSRTASSIVSYIIRNGLFRRECFDSVPDRAGNLTLHVACHSDVPKFDQILKLGERVSDYGLNGEDCMLVEYLVRANPPPCVAPYLSRNLEGDVPLHCALRTGKDWTHVRLLMDACPGSVATRTARGELPLHIAIKRGERAANVMELWERYPEAASTADGSTGLLPFQLAAVVRGGDGPRPRGKGKPRKKTRSDGAVVREDDDWDQTSLSFFMLRECPSLVWSSLLAVG